MVTKLKLIYKKNRIYRIVLFSIFMISFLGIAMSIKMQNSSPVANTLSKWEYRSQFEQSCILSDILLKISLIFFLAGCIAFAGILYDDVVFHKEDYTILKSLGFSQSTLTKMIILRYLPTFLVSGILGSFVTGIKLLPYYLAWIGALFLLLLFLLLLFLGNKLKLKTSPEDTHEAKLEPTKTILAKIQKRHILIRFLCIYKNYGVCLSFVTAIFIFMGTFCTSFVYNSAGDRKVFEKNFFINNSAIDIQWRNYTAYLKNHEKLKETYAENYKAFTMFLDENVIINKYSIDAYVSDSFSSIESPMIIAGRAPIYDDEISIGVAFAKLQGLTIGDTLQVSAKDKTCIYLITGLIQCADMGFDCELTYEGFKRIQPEYSAANTCMFFNKEYSREEITQLIHELKKEYKADIKDIENKTLESNELYAKYKYSIIYITIILAVSFIFVVTLFVRLITKCWTTSMKSQFIVLHTMGVTLKKLKNIETMLIDFYAAVGMIGGLLLSLLLNSMYNFIFSKIGLFQINFKYPVGLLIAIALVQTIIIMTLKPKFKKEDYTHV